MTVRTVARSPVTGELATAAGGAVGTAPTMGVGRLRETDVAVGDGEGRRVAGGEVGVASVQAMRKSRGTSEAIQRIAVTPSAR
jgi:hypothetical protein